MMQYLIKVLITAVLVVVVSEIAKRSSLAGAVLASVPLVSVFAMVWLYIETDDVLQVAALAKNIVWLVIPSLALFLVLPAMLARGHEFYSSLGVSIAATAFCYFLIVLLVRRWGLSG